MTPKTRAILLEDARKMADVDNIPPSLLIPQYLVHCAAYYVHGFSIIPDEAFDRLSVRMLKNWSFLEHRHKNLIDKKALKSGGHYIKIPLIVQNVAAGFKWVLEGDTDRSYVHKTEKAKVKKKVEKPKLDMDFFKKNKKPEIDMNFFKSAKRKG